MSQHSPEQKSPVWFLLGLAAAAVVLFLMRGQVAPMLAWLEQAVARAGPWGPPLFVLATAGWATLLLPGPLILALAGTLYSHQPLLAVAVVSGGFTVSQAVAFQLARTLFRDRVVNTVGEKPWFQWLEQRVEQGGARAVFFIRCLPFFPNSLANYGFGLTRVSFWPYLLASWAGTLPLLFIYILGTAGFVHLLRAG